MKQLLALLTLIPFVAHGSVYRKVDFELVCRHRWDRPLSQTIKVRALGNRFRYVDAPPRDLLPFRLLGDLRLEQRPDGGRVQFVARGKLVLQLDSDFWQVPTTTLECNGEHRFAYSPKDHLYDFTELSKACPRFHAPLAHILTLAVTPVPWPLVFDHPSGPSYSARPHQLALWSSMEKSTSVDQRLQWTVHELKPTGALPPLEVHFDLSSVLGDKGQVGVMRGEATGTTGGEDIQLRTLDVHYFLPFVPSFPRDRDRLSDLRVQLEWN